MLITILLKLKVLLFFIPFLLKGGSNTTGKLIREKNINSDILLINRYFISAIILGLLIFFHVFGFQYQFKILDLLFIIFGGLINYFLIYIFQTELKYQSSSFVNFITATSPIFYLPFGILLFHETISLISSLGILIILSGVFGLTKIKDFSLFNLKMWKVIGLLVLAWINIGYFIEQGGMILFMLLGIYLIGGSISLYKEKRLFLLSKDTKLNKIMIGDVFLFSGASIGEFYLFQILPTYQAVLFSLSILFFNIIFFKFIFKELEVIKKLLFTFVIIIGLIILKL